MSATKIVYVGDGPIEWFGVPFAPNKPIALEDMALRPSQREAMLTKARTNPFFDVTGDGAEEEDDGEEEELDGFKIVPAGRGWFKIHDPDGKIVAEGLRRQAAEAKALELAQAVS